MRWLVAIMAASALAVFDYFVVSAAFLDVPKLGEGLLALVGIGAGAAWLLRRSLPLFVAQNLLLALAAGHALGAGSRLDGQGGVTLFVGVLVSNGLIWGMGRGLRSRRA